MCFIRETSYYISPTRVFGHEDTNLIGIVSTVAERYIQQRWFYADDTSLSHLNYKGKPIEFIGAALGPPDLMNFVFEEPPKPTLWNKVKEKVRLLSPFLRAISFYSFLYYSPLSLNTKVLLYYIWEVYAVHNMFKSYLRYDYIPIGNTGYAHQYVWFPLGALAVFSTMAYIEPVIGVIAAMYFSYAGYLLLNYYREKLPKTLIDALDVTPYTSGAVYPSRHYSNGKTDMTIYNRDYAVITNDNCKIWITPRCKVFVNKKYMYWSDGTKDVYIKYDTSTNTYSIHTVNLKTGEKIHGQGTLDTETLYEEPAEDVIRKKVTTYPVLKEEKDRENRYPDVKEWITYCPGDPDKKTVVSFDKVVEDDLEMAHINIFTKEGHVYEQKGDELVMTRMENTSMMNRKGPVYGYKAVACGRKRDSYCVARLIIPLDARVVQPIKHDGELIFTHKFRCDRAYVEGFQTFDGTELEHVEEAYPYIHKHEICQYKKGFYVTADDLDLNPYEHCGKGIHFHIQPKHCLRWLLESVSADAIQEKYRAVDYVQYNEFVRSAPAPPSSSELEEEQEQEGEEESKVMEEGREEDPKEKQD